LTRWASDNTFNPHNHTGNDDATNDYPINNFTPDARERENECYHHAAPIDELLQHEYYDHAAREHDNEC
jgi:hypothetical protein